jgi:predicted glycoside hydrolase/deacetylase ChbG (UPF0249 family)
MRKLIVNADDYGHTLGLSRGILEAHRHGIVTSTSVMAGTPASAEAIRTAQARAPGLGLGLHLAITGRGRRPLLPPHQVASLVQSDGTFFPLGMWLARYTQFSAEEIAQEFAAQCIWFEAAAGRPPDHLDAHHHIAYRHAGALAALFGLAERYGVPVRGAGAGDAGLQELLQDVPEPQRGRARHAIKAAWAQGAPAHPDHFVISFYGAGANLDNLLAILENLPEGVTELMCHPGYADSTLVSDYTIMREEELRVLTGARVRTLIAAQGIELVNFGQLP